MATNSARHTTMEVYGRQMRRRRQSMISLRNGNKNQLRSTTLRMFLRQVLPAQYSKKNAITTQILILKCQKNKQTMIINRWVKNVSASTLCPPRPIGDQSHELLAQKRKQRRPKKPQNDLIISYMCLWSVKLFLLLHFWDFFNL